MTKKVQDSGLRSMTGFATSEGAFEAWTWSAELRSVNGKGLDIRMLVPDWVDGLETQARAMVAGSAKRGNVTLSIRLSRADAASPLALNHSNLDAVMDALGEIETRAQTAGLSLKPTTAADIAQLRGVLEQTSEAGEDTGPLKAALLKDVNALTQAFDAMRAQEGQALLGVMEGQLSEVARLTEEAAQQAEARKEQVAATLKQNLQKVLDAAAGVDADRVAQELALLAVKSDVTEEIDRLRTHVDAAHGLLKEGRAVGRKLDFLMQEFNREANTLCSKSQNADLTRTGLALKALIDQMREQVQNVE